MKQLTVDFGAGFENALNLMSGINAANLDIPPNLTLAHANQVHFGTLTFVTAQQDISAFDTAFFFKFPNSQPGAQIAGLSFVVQNSDATTNPAGSGLKVGGDANGAGYAVFEQIGGQTPIGKSVAVYFDQGGSGQGCFPITAKGNYSTMGLAVNGSTDLGQGFFPTNDLNPAGIDLHSGNLISCHLTYDGVTLTAVVTDTTTQKQFRISWPINLPAICGGNKAYVGFGGGTVVPTGQEIDIASWQFFEGNDTVLSAPVFSVTPGQYATAQSVSISAPVGASVLYSINGLSPTTPYTGPITISANSYIQAVAVQSGFTDSPVATALYRIGTASQINLGSGFKPGCGMIPCGNATFSGSAIHLTDTAHGGQTGAAWYGAPVDVSPGFTATFGAQFKNAQANGFCFVLQNKNQHADAGYTGKYGSSQLMVSGGPTAMGNNQNGMGYGSFQGGVGFVGLYSSVALAFDFFTKANSVGLYLNGAMPAGNQTPITGLDITKGNEITVSLAYVGTTLSMTLTDTVTKGTFSHSWSVDIPGTIGQSKAYVGFTAGTGGATADTFVNRFSFNEVAMSSTPPIINPTKFTITDPNGAKDAVTSFDVDFGRSSGQYTLTASVPLANVTVDTTAGTYTGLISDLHEQLGSGTWFAASRAVSANGVSTESPEATFQIVPPAPGAPTAFTVG